MEVKINGIDSVIDAFDDVLQGSTKTVNKILKEGSLAVSRSTKKAIHKAANRGYATGELERSVYATNPRKNDMGSYVVVAPAGTDSKGVRNGAKWGYLLHGNGKGSTPHDFKSEAVKDSENKVNRIAEKYFRELTKKLEV